MGTFSSAAADRLAALEAEARLADLEIERTPIKDLPQLDIPNMTAGEIITLANVIDAIRVLTREYDDDTPPLFASSATAERRGGEDVTNAEAERANQLRNLLAPADEMIVDTVSGPIPYADVPRDDDGRVNQEWLARECTCDDHEKRRIEADQGANESPPGMYL